MQGHPRSAKDTMGTMAAMTKTTKDSFGGNTTTAVPHIIVGANGKAAVRYVRGALLQLEMVMAFIFSFTRHFFSIHTCALSGDADDSNVLDHCDSSPRCIPRQRQCHTQQLKHFSIRYPHQ
jgi:hypothetical protein